MEAARALGGLDLRILGRHILPNCLSPVIVQGTFIFAAAVLGEAALVPWLTLFPGAAIMAGILGLNLFGDGLRDLLDPKLRGVHGAGREA